MSKIFLIVICIIIAITLILFPLIVSYKEQKNKNYEITRNITNPINYQIQKIYAKSMLLKVAT